MPRIIFFVLALFLLWRVLSAVGKRAAAGGLGADSYSRFNPRQRRQRLNLDDPPRPAVPEELLKCVQCGTYVPRGNSLAGKGADVFCCRACRDAHRNGEGSVA